MALHVDGAVAGMRIVSPMLVGRHGELRALVDAVTAPPTLVVVAGEAGIGKTRLVSELASRPEVAGRRFATGWCRRIREPFPLGPVIDAVRGVGDALAGAELSPVAGALRPLLPEIAHLLPPRPEPLDDRAAERHRVFRGLVEVLAALGPSVLVLEDLHWADEPTVEFLSYLAAAPPAELSVVVTFRVEEVDRAVRVRTGSVAHTRITLAPLGARQIGELAAAVLDASQVSDEFAEYLCERAAGSPYAAEELLALLRDRSLLVPSPSGWSRRALAELDVPDRIRDSVLERLAGLAPEARAVVHAAAVWQVPVSPAELPVELDAALRSGLLTDNGDTVGFRHPLAAQAVYEDLPHATRRELHARVAAALERDDPVPLGQLAHHLWHAGRTAAWADVARRAADQAIAHGDDAEAARLLRDLLAHAPLPPDDRGRVAATLAKVASEALLDRAVLDELRSVLDTDLSPPLRGELAFRTGLLANQLSFDDGLAHTLIAGALPDLGHRPDLRAWAMACLGHAPGSGIPVAEHVRWLEQALETLAEVDDPDVEVFVLGKVASFFAVLGDPRWREVTERMAVRAATPRTRSELNAYLSVATECCTLGDAATAGRLLAVAAPAVAVCESRKLTVRFQAVRVLLDYTTGDWAGLATTAAAVLAELTNDVRVSIEVAAAAACVALAHGDAGQARERLTVQVAAFRAAGAEPLPSTLAALARLAVAGGDATAAAARADEILAGDPALAQLAPALPAVVAALLFAGRPADAAALTDRFAVGIGGLDVPLAPVVLRHARGELAEAGGDLAAAAREYLAAAAGYDALPCGYEAARTRESAARCLLPAADAVGHLRDAIAGYDRLAARADLDRAAGLARRSGVSLPARHRGGRRGYGQGLSPREREVAELAAGGSTNKEIAATLYLSAKTVDKHLSAALRKLGLRSRVELARVGDLTTKNGESSPW